MFNDFKDWVYKHSNVYFNLEEYESIKEIYTYLQLNQTIELNDQYFNTIHSIEKQKALGIAYTPEDIRHKLINNVFSELEKRQLDISVLKFCDPCCGSGIFSISIAEKLESLGFDLVDVFCKNIYLSDKDNLSVLLSMANIYLYLERKGVDLSRVFLNIEKKDFFYEVDKYDVFITNPPYIKLQNISLSERNFLKKEFSYYFNGSIGVAPLFILKMLSNLTQYGVIGVITQNNIFTSLAAEKIRELLGYKLLGIESFGSNHIFNVSAYTCLMYLSQENTTQFWYVKDSNYSLIHTELLNPKKWRLGSEKELMLLHKMENSGLKLGDLCDISVGIATLKDKAFTVFMNEDNQWYSIDPKGNYFEIEDGLVKNLIKISSLSKENDILHNNRGVIYPYFVKDNKLMLIDEYFFQTQYPQTYQALYKWYDELIARSSHSDVNKWYQWGRKQSMYPVNNKLLTKTFNQGPNFMLDKTDSLFSNGYAIKPISISVEFIQKILNSDFFRMYAELTSFEIEGGYQCYQKNFIENFSIPQSLINDEDFILKVENIDSIIQDYY